MIWLDDAHGAGLHDGPTIPFDASDRGLLLGDGLFETMTAWNGVIFERAAHVARLVAGCAVMQLVLEPQRIEAAIDAMLAGAPAAGAVIRVTVTRGPGRRGLAMPEEARPTVMATRAPWNRDLVFQPQRLATVSIRRNEMSPVSRLKSLCYLDGVLGLAEASRAGATDALFLNTGGLIASTSMANLFVVFADRIATPPTRAGILAGIMRARLLAEGQIGGLPMVEADIAPTDITAASAMFLTNSVRLVMPVQQSDSRLLDAPGADAAGLALTLLCNAIFAECGTDPLGQTSPGRA